MANRELHQDRSDDLGDAFTQKALASSAPKILPSHPRSRSYKVSTLTGIFLDGCAGACALFNHFSFMNAYSLVSALLGCGYLDTDYLFRIAAAYELDADQIVDEAREI